MLGAILLTIIMGFVFLLIGAGYAVGWYLSVAPYWLTLIICTVLLGFSLRSGLNGSVEGIVLSVLFGIYDIILILFVVHEWAKKKG